MIAIAEGVKNEQMLPAKLQRLRQNRALIRWWLYFVCALILAMVVVGGATRLTESGLSITEWKPIHGVIPPLSEAEWEEELEKYRQIPEYQLINKGMSLDEFKFIFWWEWAHRLLGRFIGVAFFVPMVAFWATGRIEPWLKPRLLVGLALGGLQGFVGWWMVASGLVDRVDVSQYRLATHLTLALFIFAYLFWIARRLSPLPEPEIQEQERLAGLGKLVLSLVFVQMFLGGLVAGLNAGLTFNTWPLMDGQFIPRGMLAIQPIWLNFFENVMTVQFQHRMTAYVLVFTGVALAWSTFRVSRRKELRRAGAHVGGFLLLQAIFGILTLLWHVPLSIALVHQGFAVIVLAAAVDYVAMLKGPFAIRS
ncbi:COX15/CtaA family protein [Roseibium aggregatum]|uniref:Heme A synthase n=1 Tax=Roseibium aggregatum TaxID=187304 RepID=A0A0M6XV17_9HYPH|nr:COX15/CtaA family protein [Roseibium aggregatum]UES41012.1 heme A synthase [Roseibium aggregatum]UES45322.1 heme A synthase [Roseibium aggregatum]CTQ41661.1 Heme A synthase [Roseibium aggregatum]